jgi:hypothetical protein
MKLAEIAAVILTSETRTFALAVVLISVLEKSMFLEGYGTCFDC